MTKTLKTAIICSAIFCGVFAVIILLLASNIPVYGKNPNIDDNFVAWSNETPEEKAKVQLKNFLSTFKTADEAARWLELKGFHLEKPRLVSENVASFYGVNQKPLYSLGASWNVKKHGIIFAPSSDPFNTKPYIYSVGIELYYTEDEYKIHKLEITRSIL